jgi:hypothetical protein
MRHRPWETLRRRKRYQVRWAEDPADSAGWRIYDTMARGQWESGVYHSATVPVTGFLDEREAESLADWMEALASACGMVQ